jgi:Hydrogenase maturation factor
MKLGKVAGAVYARTVAKQMTLSETEMVFEEKMVFGEDKKIGIFAIASVVNRLQVQRVEILGIYIKILLPKFAFESRIKSMVLHMKNICEQYHIEVQEIDAEVSPVITSSIVQVVGVGKKRDAIKQDIKKNIKKDIKKEMDIVLTKHVGLEGSIRLLYECTEKLEARFLPSFLQRIAQKEMELFCNTEVEVVRGQDIAYMHVLGEGGIYAALWQMADTLGVGLVIEGDKILIRQETIEICEYFNLNPYQIASEGSVLMLTENGKHLQAELQKNQIPASVIGRTTLNNQRIIRRGIDVRYLDKPVPDELLKIFGN